MIKTFISTAEKIILYRATTIIITAIFTGVASALLCVMLYIKKKKREKQRQRERADSLKRWAKK